MQDSSLVTSELCTLCPFTFQKKSQREEMAFFFNWGWGEADIVECLSFSHSPAFAEEGRDSFWL